VDSFTSQGVALQEVLKKTENLRARPNMQHKAEGGKPRTAPAVAPPPDPSVLADLAKWGEVK
jgi:hypothetical protein